VAGAEQHPGGIGHATQMVVHLIQVLAAQYEGEQRGDTDDEICARFVRFMAWRDSGLL
jgi:hypothetical protein